MTNHSIASDLSSQSISRNLLTAVTGGAPSGHVMQPWQCWPGLGDHDRDDPRRRRVDPAGPVWRTPGVWNPRPWSPGSPDASILRDIYGQRGTAPPSNRPMT